MNNDTISRTAAIDILDAYQVMVENGEENPYAWARLRMSELPSAPHPPHRRSSGVRIANIKMKTGEGYLLDGCRAWTCELVATGIAEAQREVTGVNSRQAINLLKGLEQSLDDYCELNDEGKAAFRMAITALELFGNSEQLPSAQPEQQHGRVFQGIVVRYPEYCIYPEYKGKPYFSIKYTENGQEFFGYSTYKLEVLSEYLKKYFMPSAQPSPCEFCKHNDIADDKACLMCSAERRTDEQTV